jgi:putative ATPase
LNRLQKIDLETLLERAMKKDVLMSQKILSSKKPKLYCGYQGGDGRKLLNVFELVIKSSLTKKIIITNVVFEVVQQNTVLYDKTGEQHYDIVSAFIKSIRGSDPMELCIG